ncbi:hypothetical protein JRO89_XS05G0118000 [Xanthoceras sorbifolium]|uniref:Signal peptidase complex subunit 1 n=1 Tax=Xanthoceras sorbifolium TaxID=99658 RepID=A0ABQ8I218_9ROSI|nr:hypothetical protein JRO89_XS05G0118000 [Xanthoceras sorbifolium]
MYKLQTAHPPNPRSQFNQRYESNPTLVHVQTSFLASLKLSRQAALSLNFHQHHRATNPSEPSSSLSLTPRSPVSLCRLTQPVWVSAAGRLREWFSWPVDVLSSSPPVFACLSSHWLEMDWQGQKLAEQLMQILLLAFAVVALGAGYVLGSFQMMVLVYASGVVLTTLITVPNWPFFNRNPLKWLDPSVAEKHPKPQLAVSSKKKPSKK